MVELACEPVTSLYVHVPFCARKCAYCAFYSEPSTGETINRYVEALVREMELVAADLKPATVFFGGGTPSLLNLRQWQRILEAMARLGLAGAAEWTVECNPATVSLEKARLLHDFGVNRLSLGLQSLDPDLLERLGRVHTREMAFRSWDLLRKAGFDNLNLDLMFAIPGQSLESWRQTLAEAVALQSEHLSTYEVIYEEDTPLYTQLEAGEIDENEELACAMYEVLVETASGAGFRQYEVANFARDSRDGLRPGPADRRAGDVPARACRHNVNYWRGGSFYGLGPSATSYVRGVRTKNWSNTQCYCEQLERARRANESREELSPLARAGETAAFGLRMVAGWPFDEFQRVTGFDLRREWRQDMATLEQKGWGKLSAESFKLTPLGLRFADAAGMEFLRP